MVLVLDAVTPFRRSPIRQDMHRVRKAVFVDRLGWRVPVIDDEFEVDQYDTEGAVYLVALDSTAGGHLTSVRLLPSTRPHILGDFYGELCSDGAPRAANVWEISRLCAAPGLPRDKEMRARHKISAALIEYGLLRGITRYTCVLNIRWLSTLLAPGWPCEPLGPPQTIDGELLGAFAISISPATLQAFLGRWGGAFPVLEFPDRKVA
jgi:N-acyl-L-homoserine lactone synthetase